MMNGTPNTYHAVMKDVFSIIILLVSSNTLSLSSPFFMHPRRMDIIVSTTE